MASAALAEQEPQIAGEYRATDSFEMYRGLLLRPDGTFAYALSVGALDQRSSGTWTQQGNTFDLVTTPKPVPPEFAQVEAAKGGGAPFLAVMWPNGRGIAGIDVTLGCEGQEPLYDYTQEDGWSPPSGACARPLWVQLAEPVHDIRSPRFTIETVASGLRFVLQPNSFGVIDLTGARGVVTGDRLVFHFDGREDDFVRIAPL